jgi:hypothetical protein
MEQSRLTVGREPVTTFCVVACNVQELTNQDVTNICKSKSFKDDCDVECPERCIGDLEAPCEATTTTIYGDCLFIVEQ